jgi:hypothetical protein
MLFKRVVLVGMLSGVEDAVILFKVDRFRNCRTGAKCSCGPGWKLECGRENRREDLDLALLSDQTL